MHRYRVHIVPRTGRYAPLLTVLVEADSRDEAFQLAQVRCASSKVVSAEDVKDCRGTERPRWLHESSPDGVRWGGRGDLPSCA